MIICLVPLKYLILSARHSSCEICTYTVLTLDVRNGGLGPEGRYKAEVGKLWPVGHKWPSIGFVNKVILEHSYVYVSICCL